VDQKESRFPLGPILLLVVGFLLLQFLLFGTPQENLPYGDFKRLLRAGQVTDLVIGEQTISGQVQPEGAQKLLPAATAEALERTGRRFTTVRVEDPGLLAEIEEAGVRYAGRAENRWGGMLLILLLPALLIIGFWIFMLRRMGGGAGGLMSIGKSKAKVYFQQSTGVSFDDVAGIDEARGELMEVVDFLKDPRRYQRLGGKIPKGVLLVGPPGTGKTLLAKAVAGEAGVPFFSLSGSDFVEMFVGVGAARVRDLFAQAQAKAPSIVFIDELDAVGKARGVSPAMAGHDEREQTLNQLLAELDGFDSQQGVIILGATNRPEILDPALLRPGRFDRQVIIDRPDLHGRELILRVHTRKVRLGPDVDIAAMAARTPGLTGADLANLINEAALQAGRARKDVVEMIDFETALDRIVAGLERKSKVMSPRERELVAHHEAGHALVAESRQHVDPVSKISIIPRSIGSLGHTQQQPREDRYLLTRAELLDRIDVLLGGRVAEELIFGDISTGAQDDLRRATELARAMVMQYGMGEVGLATFGGQRQSAYLNVAVPEEKVYSEASARAIDREIQRLLAEARTRVHGTLTARRGDLEALAKLLMDREVVDRAALRELLDRPGAA
jgi:cell division protease FtsH